MVFDKLARIEKRVELEDGSHCCMVDKSELPIDVQEELEDLTVSIVDQHGIDIKGTRPDGQKIDEMDIGDWNHCESCIVAWERFPRLRVWLES